MLPAPCFVCRKWPFGKIRYRKYNVNKARSQQLEAGSFKNAILGRKIKQGKGDHGPLPGREAKERFAPRAAPGTGRERGLAQRGSHGPCGGTAAAEAH